MSSQDVPRHGNRLRQFVVICSVVLMGATMLPLAAAPANAAAVERNQIDGFGRFVQTLCYARDAEFDRYGPDVDSSERLDFEPPDYIVRAGDNSDLVTVNPDWVAHAITYFTPCSAWENALGIAVGGRSVRDVWDEYGLGAGDTFWECMNADPAIVISPLDIVICARNAFTALANSADQSVRDSKIVQALTHLTDDCSGAIIVALLGGWISKRAPAWVGVDDMFGFDKLTSEFYSACRNSFIVRMILAPGAEGIGTPSDGYWTASEFWGGAIKESIIGAFIGGATARSLAAAIIQGGSAFAFFVLNNEVTIVPGATQNWHYWFRRFDDSDWQRINANDEYQDAITALGSMITDLQADAVNNGSIGLTPAGACAEGQTCPRALPGSFTVDQVNTLLEVLRPIVGLRNAPADADKFLNDGLPLAATYRAEYHAALGDHARPQYETAHRWLVCAGGPASNYETCVNRDLPKPGNFKIDDGGNVHDLNWTLVDDTQVSAEVVVRAARRYDDAETPLAELRSHVDNGLEYGLPTQRWKHLIPKADLNITRCVTVHLEERNLFETASEPSWICNNEAPQAWLGDFGGRAIGANPVGANWGNYLHWDFPGAGPAAMNVERRGPDGNWQTVKSLPQPVALSGRVELPNTALGIEQAQMRLVATFTSNDGDAFELRSNEVTTQPRLRFVGTIERVSDSPDSGVQLHTQLEGATVEGPWDRLPTVNFTITHQSENAGDSERYVLDAVMDAAGATFNVPSNYLVGGGTYCASFNLPAPTGEVAFWSQRLRLLSRHCTELVGLTPITIETDFGSCTVHRSDQVTSDNVVITTPCRLALTDAPSLCVPEQGDLACSVPPTAAAFDCAEPSSRLDAECTFAGSQACFAAGLRANEPIEASMHPPMQPGGLQAAVALTRVVTNPEAVTQLRAYVCPLQINETLIEVGPSRDEGSDSEIEPRSIRSWESTVENISVKSQTGESLVIPLQVHRAVPTGDGEMREPTSEASELSGLIVEDGTRNPSIEWSWLPANVDTEEIVGYQVTIFGGPDGQTRRELVTRGANHTIFVDSDLVPGFQYCARVRTVRPSGLGAITPFECLHPARPQLPAVANLNVADGANHLTGSWDPIVGDYDHLEGLLTGETERSIVIEHGQTSVELETAPGHSCLRLRTVLTTQGRTFHGPFSLTSCGELKPTLPSVTGLAADRQSVGTQWSWTPPVGNYELFEIESTRPGQATSTYTVPATQTTVVWRIDARVGERCLRLRTKLNADTPYTGPWTSRECFTIHEPAPRVITTDVNTSDSSAEWAWSLSNSTASRQELGFTGAIDRIINLGGNARSHRIDLPIGETCGRIRTFNAVESPSNWGPERCATRLPDLASPTNINVEFAWRPRSVLWTWTPVADADRYRLVFTGPNAPDEPPVVTNSWARLTEYEGNKNCLSVIAVADDGRESAPTATACWDSTPLDTPQPTGDHIRSLAGQSGFVWTWDRVEGAEQYLYSITGPTGEQVRYSGGVEPLARYEPNVGGTHCATVTATVIAIGRSASPPSEPVCITRLTTPEDFAVSQGTAEGSAVPVTWSWAAVDGATGYRVNVTGPRWFQPINEVIDETSRTVPLESPGRFCATVTAYGPDGRLARGGDAVHPSPVSDHLCIDGPQQLATAQITDASWRQRRPSGYSWAWDDVEDAASYRVTITRPGGEVVEEAMTTATSFRVGTELIGTLCASVVAVADSPPLIDGAPSERRCATSYTPHGDVNCDAVVDAVDAMFIMQFTVGARADHGTCSLPLDGDWLNATNGDVSEDGVVDAVDALFITQCTVGIANVLCPSVGPIRLE